MLSTLLTNLQNLISTRFLLGSFLPTLAFWFAHAAMLFALNARFEAYVRNNIGQTAGLTAVLMSACLIGIAMSAYVFSALLPATQSLLEGNWPAWMVHFFVPAQMRHLERLDGEVDGNAKLRGSFGTAATGQSRAQLWRETLKTARVAGNSQTGNAYTFQKPSAREVRRLARLRRSGRAIDGDDLNKTVTLLTFDLRANNADLAGTDNDKALEKTRLLLWKLIEYADEYAAAQYRQLMTQRHFSFGAWPLAPTRMGNVAKTIQYYSVQRYNFNFELFWSRLQLPVQRDKDFGSTLQDSKALLDLLISCSALTFVWAVVWAAWLYLSGGAAWLFAAVALVGPTLAYLWYRVAVAHYRTFADVLRSSVDLFRFSLLNALHYPSPDGVDQERELWRTIDALHALLEVRDLRYVDAKTP
jgi:hypothetical protein